MSLNIHDRRILRPCRKCLKLTANQKGWCTECLKAEADKPRIRANLELIRRTIRGRGYRP